MIGHILRKDRNDDRNVDMSWAPEGKKRRGRPKTTWRRTVEKERQEAGWGPEEEVRTAATNRKERKSSVKPYVPRGTERIDKLLVNRVIYQNFITS